MVDSNSPHAYGNLSNSSILILVLRISASSRFGSLPAMLLLLKIKCNFGLDFRALIISCNLCGL